MSDFLNDLNEQQRIAVEYTDGPQLVIAGAGSGKTRVLTYKIAMLLSKGYEPWRIMALTFTNKAAAEMRQRITDIAGEKTASRLVMGTFHSVFARILRANASRLGISADYTIYDAADSRNLIKTIVKAMDLDEKIYKPSTLASLISNAKNGLVTADMYVADRHRQKEDAIRRIPLAGQIYAAYTARLRAANAMDFDDLLLNTNILLRDNDDVRRHYQEFFRYILVDEYQDTNFAQHSIVAQLSAMSRRVCMVGDDAQSIYSFRGANIHNILGLKNTFPELVVHKLERNYRSSENIINAAGSLISKNLQQIPKNVFSENGPGDRIEVVRCYSDYEEAALIANRIIQRRHASGDSYSDFAVLYRTNAQSRVLEESLRSRNIPYRIYGGQSFYERKEVRDAVAYFRLALNPNDDEALGRVINVPARSIGDTTKKKLTDTAMAAGVSVWQVVSSPGDYTTVLNNGTLRKIAVFADIVRRLHSLTEQGRPADEVVRAALTLSGLSAMYVSDSTPENISRFENLQELLAKAAQFVQDRREEGDGTSMAEFMTEISLASDLDNGDEADAARVTLMTIHASKGLEFDNIFVAGVEEDLLPSAMSMDTLAQIEEERRLLYVAVTRAKRFCMLSYATSRFRNGATAVCSPSRFLRDFDTACLRFVTGTEIASGERAVPRPAWTADRPRSTAQRRVQPPSSSGKIAPAPASGGEKHSADELSVGMIIEHSRFGRGTITGIDGDNPSGARITVNFNNVEVKTLLLRFANFKILQ